MPLSSVSTPESSENFEIPSISLMAGQTLPTPTQFQAACPELYSVDKVRDHLRQQIKIPSFSVQGFPLAGSKIESFYRQTLETCISQLKDDQIEFRTLFRQGAGGLEGKLHIANSADLAHKIPEAFPVLLSLHQLHDAIKKANASIDTAKSNLDSSEKLYDSLELERQSLVGPVNKPLKYPTSSQEFSEKKKRLGIVKQELLRSKSIAEQHALILNAVQTHLARVAVMIMNVPNFIEQSELKNWVRDMRLEPSDASIHAVFGRTLAAYQPHQEIRLDYPHIAHRKALKNWGLGLALSVGVFGALSMVIANRDRIMKAVGIEFVDPKTVAALLDTPFFKNSAPVWATEEVKEVKTQNELLNVLIRVMTDVGMTSFQEYLDERISRDYATHPTFPDHILMRFQKSDVLHQIEEYFGAKVTMTLESKDKKLAPLPYIPEIQGYAIPKNDFCYGAIQIRAQVLLPGENTFQLVGNIIPNHELDFFKKECF